MNIYIALLVLITLSIIVMLVLIFRRLADIAALQVDSIPEERASKVKNRIILERLLSKSRQAKKMAGAVVGPLASNLGRQFSQFQQKVAELEKKNVAQKRPLQGIDAKRRSRELIVGGQTFFEQEKLAEAEAAYIESIELEATNPDAYRGLVEVYRTQRDYKKARETCRFELKLLAKKAGRAPANGDQHRLARCYADLGEIYQLENKISLAQKNFEKAVDLEPSNPRFLDLLLKISILVKNKELAWQMFNRLQEANPDNQKLSELKKEVEGLSVESAPTT